MAHPILVPPLGQTTDTVILSAWYKQAGQTVKIGEPLFAIETDKATLDIEAQDAGILAQVSAQAGEEVKVLSAIGLIAAPGEAVSTGEPGSGAEYRASGATEPEERRSGAENHAPVAETQGSGGAVQGIALQTQRSVEAVAPVSRVEGERVFISPRARRLALAENVRWQSIAGTGPEGAIVERDVRQYLTQINQAPQTVPTQAPSYSINPAQAAQTLVAQADVSALITLCERYARREVSVSLEGVLIYILAQVVRTLPVDALAPASLSIGYVTPGQGRFVMPVLESLHTKGLVSLTREISEIATRAQAGSLQPTEQHEPTIGFTSLAALGLDLFTPVVEAPGTPMLGVGRVHQNHAGERMAWFSLSYAGTRLDALAAARLLQQVIARVEDPDLLF
jgi:pyruvate dehydrogenase E2 component (dihydrolipoamide acetyltransferase)